MKNIIITGATKGIGRALVDIFAANGFNVAICARSTKDLELLAQELKTQYPNIKVLYKATDMSKKEDVVAFGNYIKEHWTSIDVLINNAGVFIPCTVIEPSNEDKFVTMMDTNLYSAYYMTNSVLDTFLTQQQGHIINICSIASIMPYSAYSVSKFALLGYTKVLREELKEKGIRVTAILPGATLTPSWNGVDLPKERFMTAEDIAKAVYNCYELSPYTVVEEMVLRPQLGQPET